MVMNMVTAFIMMGALLSITIPLIMSVMSWAMFYIPSGYVRRSFFRAVGWTSSSDIKRRLSLSITPWIYAAVAIISASISVTFELIVALSLLLVGIPEKWSAFLMVVSAGPIEEGAKFLCALLLFLIVDRAVLRRSKGGRDPVKDAILVGFFVGCSFGFVESVGYLAIGFSGIIKDGLSYSTIDPVVWRTFLGVPIHGLYTAIACAGLGRKAVLSRIIWTAIGLSSAVMLHSLNNGILGVFVFLLERESASDMMLIDGLQLGLIFVGLFILVIAWNIKTHVQKSNIVAV